MAAASQTVTAPGTISPKVFWPLVVVVVLTFLGTFLAALTPETLSGLGAFAVPMSLSLAAIAQVITGYLKSDELRGLGVQATAAVLAVPPSDVVTPPVVAVDPLEESRARAATAAGRDPEAKGLVKSDPEDSGSGGSTASGV